MPLTINSPGKRILFFVPCSSHGAMDPRALKAHLFLGEVVLKFIEQFSFNHCAVLIREFRKSKFELLAKYRFFLLFFTRRGGTRLCRKADTGMSLPGSSG